MAKPDAPPLSAFADLLDSAAEDIGSWYEREWMQTLGTDAAPTDATMRLGKTTVDHLRATAARLRKIRLAHDEQPTDRMIGYDNAPRDVAACAEKP